MPPVTEDLAAWVGGFVAAEGCFTACALATKSRFGFQVGLGAADRSTCQLLQEVFGVGRLVAYARRRPHYDDETAFVVARLGDLVEVIVPFMDAHLPRSYKRVQYLAWRADLLGYWDGQARRRRPCRIEGCSSPAFASGLCRPHLWSEMRR